MQGGVGRFPFPMCRCPICIVHLQSPAGADVLLVDFGHNFIYDIVNQLSPGERMNSMNE